MMKNIFDPEVHEELIQRIDKLNANTHRLWGTMTSAQMLAHCCVIYEYCYNEDQKPLNPILRTLFKLLLKPSVAGTKPYKKNSKTAPQFIIKGDKDFDFEKKRLKDYLEKTMKLGTEHFEGRFYYSFGKMTAEEWNNMFYKHLDHHLSQFGV